MVDNLAAVWGEDACVETPRAGATSSDWQGRWLTVYQLQPDGSWLIVRDSGEEANDRLPPVAYPAYRLALAYSARPSRSRRPAAARSTSLMNSARYPSGSLPRNVRARATADS